MPLCIKFDGQQFITNIIINRRASIFFVSSDRVLQITHLVVNLLLYRQVEFYRQLEIHLIFECDIPAIERNGFLWATII